MLRQMQNPVSPPVVIVAEGSDAKPLDWLKERARVLEIPYDAPGFDAALAQADGLLVRTYTRVNSALLAKAPRLRVVGRGGVGLENIDIPACQARGVQVVYTPDANTLAVGDFVFGYLLQLLRPWNFFGDTAYAPAEFKRIRNSVRGRQLNELTMGILGMGRVGRRVGSIAANGFGMRVIYNDLLDIPASSLPFPAAAVDKPTLYQQADVLSLHVTMRSGNQNLIDAGVLSQMKPDAIVVNTSRGEVLDAQALADALRAGKIGGAAIDVFHPEPPGSDLPLLGCPNCLLTPHLAARTYTAIENMSWVVKDVMQALDGTKNN